MFDVDVRANRMTPSEKPPILDYCRPLQRPKSTSDWSNFCQGMVGGVGAIIVLLILGMPALILFGAGAWLIAAVIGLRNPDERHFWAGFLTMILGAILLVAAAINSMFHH